MTLVRADGDIRFGEVIPPQATVAVYGTTHPLNAMAGSRIHRHMPAGWTIAEILEGALEERSGILDRMEFVITINGDAIKWSDRHRIRPKAGTVVTFVPRLQGGNNQLLRSVLSVVVAVAAIALAAPTGGLSLGLAAVTGVSVNVASALIAGGIVADGPIAIDALWSLAAPRLSICHWWPRSAATRRRLRRSEVRTRNLFGGNWGISPVGKAQRVSHLDEGPSICGCCEKEGQLGQLIRGRSGVTCATAGAGNRVGICGPWHWPLRQRWPRRWLCTVFELRVWRYL